MKEERPKIVSLLDKRAQQGLKNELDLTYTIAEEIDYLHDRVDLVNKNLLTLTEIVKQLIPDKIGPTSPD